MDAQTAALCIDNIAKTHAPTWAYFWRTLAIVDEMMLYTPGTPMDSYVIAVCSAECAKADALTAERRVIDARRSIAELGVIALASGLPITRTLTSICSGLSPIAHEFVPGNGKHRTGPGPRAVFNAAQWTRHHWYTPLWSALPPEQDPDMGD